MSRLIAADRDRAVDALWPLGTRCRLVGESILRPSMPDDAGLARLQLRWEGRDGQPIERTVRLEDAVEGKRFAMRVVEDTSLDRVLLVELSRDDRACRRGRTACW